MPEIITRWHVPTRSWQTGQMFQYATHVIDLLLPTTDAGVIARGVVAAVLIGLGIWQTRTHRDRRIFVVASQ